MIDWNSNAVIGTLWRKIASVVRFRMDLLLLYFSGNFQEKEDSGTKWITLFGLQPF